MAEVSSRAGMPVSSYACMEVGHYGISLENLSRILAALETDIEEVWPNKRVGLKGGAPQEHSYETQMFRLNEIVSLSGSQGGALLAGSKGRYQVLLRQGLDEAQIEEILQLLADRSRPLEGLTFCSQKGQKSFLLYLQALGCPRFVKQLIRHYLTIWKQVFD
jgi:hypothetical protein